MAIVTGTTWTASQASGFSTMNSNMREDLSDVIYELDPMDTWAVSNLQKTKANNVYHEWLLDNLQGATANRQVEGDDTSFTTAPAATRVGNYCQITRKSFIVSGTLEAVKKAGRKSELARLGTKYMKEMKRDIEQALVGNQASSAGGSATARSSGGIESWIAGPTASAVNTPGNAVAATTSAATATTIGYSSGTVTAPTDGTTTGALTENTLKSALQGAWEDGGDPSVILAGATAKKYIDGFTGIATRFVDSSPNKQAAIVGAANMYVSGFGSPHAVILHRYIRSSVVLCLDPEYWAVAFLRQPFTETLAKTGDGEKRHMLAEFTLESRNYQASSKVVCIA